MGPEGVRKPDRRGTGYHRARESVSGEQKRTDTAAVRAGERGGGEATRERERERGVEREKVRKGVSERGGHTERVFN